MFLLILPCCSSRMMISSRRWGRWRRQRKLIRSLTKDAGLTWVKLRQIIAMRRGLIMMEKQFSHEVITTIRWWGDWRAWHWLRFMRLMRRLMMIKMLLTTLFRVFLPLLLWINIVSSHILLLVVTLTISR